MGGAAAAGATLPGVAPQGSALQEARPSSATSKPVLLQNPQGWSNVTRFTALTMAKLSALERRSERNSAMALGRAVRKVEQRQLREAFAVLHRYATLDSFVSARGHAEDMLQRLHSLVDSFDLECDHLVDNIVQSTLDEDDSGLHSRSQ